LGPGRRGAGRGSQGSWPSWAPPTRSRWVGEGWEGARTGQGQHGRRGKSQVWPAEAVLSRSLMHPKPPEPAPAFLPPPQLPPRRPRSPTGRGSWSGRAVCGPRGRSGQRTATGSSGRAPARRQARRRGLPARARRRCRRAAARAARRRARARARRRTGPPALLQAPAARRRAAALRAPRPLGRRPRLRRAQARRRRLARPVAAAAAAAPRATAAPRRPPWARAAARRRPVQAQTPPAWARGRRARRVLAAAARCSARLRMTRRTGTRGDGAAVSRALAALGGRDLLFVRTGRQRQQQTACALQPLRLTTPPISSPPNPFPPPSDGFDSDWRDALPITSTGRQHASVMVVAPDCAGARAKVGRGRLLASGLAGGLWCPPWAPPPDAALTPAAA
jgi:hypothetical protein